MGTQLETPSGAPTGTTPKFSRYRSVRRAAAEAQNQWTGDAPPVKNETIARSMSRYRRPKTANGAPANCPPVPSLPVSAQLPQPVRPRAEEALSPLSGASHSEKVQSPLSDREDEDQLSEAEKARMREEAMRKLTMAERPKASAMLPQAHQDSRSKSAPANDRERGQKGVAGHSRRASWKDRLGLSHHKKEDTTNTNNSNNNNNIALADPGLDAPVSAVNAGERRVLVKCKSSSIRLPVTPTTRVKDIVFSAANCFSESIDPRNAIILESFASLGLERPLRRYEHVRDVLNSWSSDDANALIISDPPFDGASRKLELHAAPTTQPKDAKFYLYHSSKPGKWDKRYITLRADGQVVLSKKSDAKEAKDFTNVCHMSDFDIYTPTARQVAKSIRPPKKICFAIKKNFVRFFAASDSTIAQDFHDAVHAWRSWYLVHVLEVGKAQNETAHIIPTPKSRDGHSSPTQHQRHISTDTIPYQLGSFTPLIEFGRNAEPTVAVYEKLVEEPSATSRDMFLRKKKTRDHAPPPSSFPVNLPALETKKEALSPPDDDSTFSPDSLLGRTYSERQAAQREREGTESDPFLSHGLLKNLSPTSTDQSSQIMPFSNPSSRQNSRSNTVRSHHHPAEGFSHSRSNSVRQKGKPLVDLTPTYREPPHHARKGHGVKVDSGIPLVEVATGLEAIPGVPTIPSATTWRRDEAAPAPIPGHRRANTVKSQHHNHVPVLDTYVSPSGATSFTPNGLVALASPATQTNTSVGRGVATGDRHATRPLLDMTPQSQFAEGSLLRSIEKL
ncbi:conserved hypothetical protein [Talaromyces stipitatus ATCC 10500]|uniref:PH domain-containing protein n=1 Tax=Talaromyces stipitatus (strain ATCC 10500 / CBS 375.48 / QM 6759 / NRRL 1006) TaxID=441959 RepID=B8MAW1_TALSN|nr:uncharacterized protein TSTA_115930 [Talaromyces stipitatus ATCC 10500]EED17801.1 conserved hypothetical protein [Talaromyces stipitatus ATCC 10500]